MAKAAFDNGSNSVVSTIGSIGRCVGSIGMCVCRFVKTFLCVENAATGPKQTSVGNAAK